VLVAGITSSITSFVGNHSVVAVFTLLVAAAVFPAASELVMLYAGAVAAGAFADTHVVVFGHAVSSHAGAYVAIAIAGVAGNLVGATIGWAIGDYGGRPLLERHGRFLHVTPAKLDRAERWFDRHGALAVLLGFAAPIVRSFVAIPAGIARVPFVRFIVLALVGCALFCFAFAGIGWGVGSKYGSVRRYVDYIALVAIVLGVAYLAWSRVRSTRLARGRASDTTH
jgi:membrane protein DedA with SNARE-associated domain